jgi:hypothetical protein
MEAKNMHRADFVTSMLLIIFGIGVFISSVQMPTFAEQGVNPYSAPGIVPGFLGAIITVLGLVLLIRSILRKGYRLGVNGMSVRTFLTAEMTKRFAVTIIVSVIYGLGLIGRLPYEIATAVYAFAFIFIFEYKWKAGFRAQWKRVLLAAFVAVLVAGAVGSVFRYLFLVNLPGNDLF